MTAGTSPVVIHAAPRASRGLWRDAYRRLLRNGPAVLGLVFILIFVIGAVLAPLIAPYDPAFGNLALSKHGPTAAHLFGTDLLGRDELSRVLYGARISLIVGVVAVMFGLLFGVTVGAIAGGLGGKVDTVLMRITDFFLVLPTFVLALILAPIILDLVGANSEFFGIRVTLLVIVVVIGVTSWASTARIIRSQALSVKELAFVGRARVIGSGPGHIMWRHILPNVMNLIVANTVLVFGGSILTETTLSFIGLGDPFAPSWGQVLNAAESAGAMGLGAWWYVVPPSVCIVLVVLAFTLVGSALDDVLNPRLRVRR